MANLLSFDCPIDGLTLSVNATLSLRGQVLRDANSHLHLVIDSGPHTCPNGHIWDIMGDLVLLRRG